MNRRPKGTGTIRRTPKGAYRALFAFVAGGKREDLQGSPFPTRKAAEAALDALLAGLQEVGADRGGITLKRLGKLALDWREKAGYRSVDKERSLWTSLIENTQMAAWPASALTRSDVRSWLASLSGKGLKTQTRRNALNLLRAVLNHGVEEELFTENVTVGMKVKHRGETQETSTYLTRSEAEALIAAATDPAVALAIGTGLRSGELRSLRWKDVRLDDEKPEITVRYGSPDKPTKNGKIRTVPLFGVALAAMQQAYETRGDSEIVLPSFSGWYRQAGRVVDPAMWKEWKAKAKLTRRVRWHDLRHTCATLLLTGAWGRAWSLEEVKEMLGHSSVKVTERYAKSTGTLADKAAAEMRKDKGKIGARAKGPEVVQAREIIERCGWDLNPRMSVLQTPRKPLKNRAPVDVSLLCRSYVQAVASGDPHAHTKGLALADALLAGTENQRTKENSPETFRSRGQAQGA